MKRTRYGKRATVVQESESDVSSDSDSTSTYSSQNDDHFSEEEYDSEEEELLVPRKKQRLETQAKIIQSRNQYRNIHLVKDLENRYGNEKIERKLIQKFGSKIKEIYDEVEKRNITMEQIYELTLEMDEYVWFSQYIKVRDEIDNGTEDKINLTNNIYNKYSRLKNIDYRKMENLKKDSITDKCIVKKIIDSDHSDYTKTILYKKYKLFCENHDSNSEEYSKCIEWIDTVLCLPTQVMEPSPTRQTEIGNKLSKLHNFLSTKIYGLSQVKEQIMQAMYRKIQNPFETSGKIITLVGPPGVGKTWVASIIAEAMDVPFDQLSFGSIQDAKTLTGHSSTYIGAVPGLFTKTLIKAKRKDVLILLDEIDKITNTSDSNITSVLLHVLDKSQNHRFKDIYIPEIPLDLSQIIFLGAANDINMIDPILRDRMVIIDLPGYTIQDKINIAEIYLIPKFKRELHFDDSEILIGNKELEYLILNKTQDQPGMRDVERKLQDLFEKLGLLKHNLRHKKAIPYTFDVKNIKFPLKITTVVIDKLLGENIGE